VSRLPIAAPAAAARRAFANAGAAAASRTAANAAARPAPSNPPQKDSAWLPGKKGISIVEGDWHAVKGAMAAASAAAEAKDLAFNVQLSGK
jgi:hypothetical protein